MSIPITWPGLLRLLRKCKFHIPVYLTRLTAPEIDWEDCEPRLELFQAGMSFTIGDIEVSSFSIPHDARDPVGFCFKAEGVRVGDCDRSRLYSGFASASICAASMCCCSNRITISKC